METQSYNIRRGTEIDVPYRGSIITFPWQKYGPDSYNDVGKEIEQDDLEKPTMAKTTFLLYPAFVGDIEGKEPEFNELKKTIRHPYWLWAFTPKEYSTSVTWG